jgi:SAM-dependent methyltransferase
MNQPSNETPREKTARLIRERVASWDGVPSIEQVNAILRVTAMWRSIALAQTFIAHSGGTTVAGGPFAGMAYVSVATEGALIARLLGVYESELHPHFEAFIAEGLDCVIDVGCAEGYYAVGLARRMPDTTVYAFDILETARAACAGMAVANGVRDRVLIGGEFRPEDFQRFAGRRALVLVDAEGAEVDILDPARGPALAGMNIIVETHDVYRPGALSTLMERFSPTHDIQRVDQDFKAYDQPAWIKDLNHLDQLLTVWEWRQRPTPWLVMRPKAG